MTTNIRQMLVSIAIIGAAVIGCAKTETDDDAAIQDTAATNSATAPAGPSDAEIAHIVVTANTIDVEAGRLAKDKARNQEVVQFGNRMITDHTAVNEQASQLASRLNLTPADNSTSQSLKSSADQTMQDLQGKSGADFDRAYIEHEVTYHEQVLDAIDNTLIPNAKNADVRALLEQTRPAIVAHLEMARKIQNVLSSR